MQIISVVITSLLSIVLHTASSADVKSGFTYSKPSNSDWSIDSSNFLKYERNMKI
jgi:hypothetical protein